MMVLRLLHQDLEDIFDLETELLSWPQKIEDGFSAADLNILEMFFNLDEMVEPKEETDNQ